MPENIFEKTLSLANAERQKKLTEKKVPVTTKATKKVTEDKKPAAKKTATKTTKESLKKRYSVEDYDPDLDPSPDGEEGLEYDGDVDMPGVSDDIVVVVDPEKTEDEVTDAAQEIQDIIDETPEGEEPSTDEYIGDDLYQCPICGQTFVSEVGVTAGDECPVCGQTPDDFVSVGEVSGSEEPESADEAEDSSKEDEGGEDLDLDVPEEDEDEEEEKEESRKPVRKITYTLDENTFNPILTKFVTENYKNAKSLKVVGATQKGSRLTLECKLTMKSGKTKNVNLKVENYKVERTMRWQVRDDGTFKVESRKTIPFVFKTTLNKGNVIKCENMRYNYITKAFEGKRAQIHGSVLSESARPTPAKRPVAPARRPAVAAKPKTETKTTSAKRPVSSGVKKN